MRWAKTLRRRCALLLVTAAAAGMWPSSAAADPALNEGLDRLAAKVAEFIGKEQGEQAVVVGDFIAPPRLKAGGGPGLSQQIAAALTKRKVAVRDGAPFQIFGSFTVRDEKARQEDQQESVALRITASILSKNDDELGKINISIFGDAPLQIAGGTADLPPNETEERRQQRIRDGLEKPRAAVVGNETRSASESPFGVEVRVRRGLSSDSTAKSPELEGGRSFVPLATGEEYIVRLHNRAKSEAAVTLTIDGLNMFAFSSEGNFGSQVLVPPGKFVDIPGWYITNQKTDVFEITSYAKSAAAARLKPPSSVGVITATFHESVEAQEKDPNATGRGRQIDQKYVQVMRVVKEAQSVVSVRYNR